MAVFAKRQLYHKNLIILLIYFQGSVSKLSKLTQFVRMTELDHRNNLDLCRETLIINLWRQRDPSVTAGKNTWDVSQALTSRSTNLRRSGLELL